MVLSHDAQAVWDEYVSTSVRPVAHKQLAAALRAVAAIPSASAPVPFTYKLLDIADELEGHA
jgi:hypothetical protein